MGTCSQIFLKKAWVPVGIALRTLATGPLGGPRRLWILGSEEAFVRRRRGSLLDTLTGPGADRARARKIFCNRPGPQLVSQTWSLATGSLGSPKQLWILGSEEVTVTGAIWFRLNDSLVWAQWTFLADQTPCIVSGYEALCCGPGTPQRAGTWGSEY